MPLSDWLSHGMAKKIKIAMSNNGLIGDKPLNKEKYSRLKSNNV